MKCLVAIAKIDELTVNDAIELSDKGFDLEISGGRYICIYQ